MKVSFEDVVQHTLQSLEDATRKDSVKACRSLTQDLVKEILQEGNQRSNRRLAVERGVVQSLVLIIKQFSVKGTEKDASSRLSLVASCLDILLDLKPFVKLDDFEEVPICVLLRSYGVSVLSKSLEMHWNLRTKPVELLSKTLTLLHNVSMSEQGTRMLVECQIDVLLMDFLENNAVLNRDLLLLSIKVLSSMALLQPSTRAICMGGFSHSGEPDLSAMSEKSDHSTPLSPSTSSEGITSRIQTLLHCGESIGKDDFAFHKELVCLLCMISTMPVGAEAILSCETFLGYAVNILDSSSSAAVKADRVEKEKLETMCVDNDAVLASLDHSALPSLSASAGPSTVASSAPSGPGTFSSTNEQLLSMDTINSTARNAVSAGSQLINNLMRRPNQPTAVKSIPTETPESKASDSRTLACWASMLLHNLCLFSYENVQMRMVISQAYETNNAALGTEVNRPIFQRVLRTMSTVCDLDLEKMKEQSPDEDTIDLLQFDDEPSARNSEAHLPLLDRVVQDIVSGLSDAEALGEKEDDFTGRAVLFCLEFLRTKSSPVSLTLEDILRKLLEKFTSFLTDPKDGIPPALPICADASRILSFVFLVLAHPILQKRLFDEPQALHVIIGSPSGEDLSFLSIIRGMDIPEYSSMIEQYIHSLVDIHQGRLKVFPMLPYRSFQMGHLVGSTLEGSTIPLQRQTSVDPNSPSNASSPKSVGEDGKPGSRRSSFSNSPGLLKGKSFSGSRGSASSAQNASSGLQVDTSAATGRRSIRSQSIASLSPSTRFGLKSNARSTRRGSTPYVPSHSHVVLSPLLNDMNLKTVEGESSNGDNSTVPDEHAQVADATVSSKEASGDATSSPPGSPAESGQFSLYDWLQEPENLAIQMSLRLEKLYMVTDPSRIVMLAFLDASHAERECTAETRFLAEYDKLVYLFKKEILAGPTPLARAKMVECVIDIAYYSASALLRNASLTMACLEALGSSSIRRLELTWRNVEQDKWQLFEEIKRLCGFLGDSNMSLGLEPPPMSPAGKKSSSPLPPNVPAISSGKGSPCISSSGLEDQGVSLFLRSAPGVGDIPSIFIGGSRIPFLHGALVALRRSAAAISSSGSPTCAVSGPGRSSPKRTRSAGKEGEHGVLTTPQEPKSPLSTTDDLLNFDDLPTDMEVNGISNGGGTASPRKGTSSPVAIPGPAPLIKTSSNDFDPLGLFAHEAADKKNRDGQSPMGAADGDNSVPERESKQIDMAQIHVFYEVLARWIPTIRGNGDWFQRLYAHQPIVQLQILLKGIPSRNRVEESKMDQVSLRQEPPWALEQMLLESLLAIEGWIESLFDSESQEEGKVIRAFRTRIRKQDAQASAARASTSANQSSAALASSTVNSAASSNAATSSIANSGVGPGMAQAASQVESRQTSARLRSFGETAAAQILFRGAGSGTDVSSSSSLASPGTVAQGSALLESVSSIPAAAAGKLISSLVKKISVARRERLLVESGSRSAEHWDKIVDHVRLCVERVVLAPVWSRLLLGAMRQHIKEECALQERVLILKGVSQERMVDVLGLPRRNDLHLCKWQGAIATLRSFEDVDMPSLKLKVLLRLKDEIYQEAADRGVLDMNADEFLPVVTLVIVRTQLFHAYSTTMLLRELLSEEFVSGEAAYYLTTFEIALGHLLYMELPSDIIDAHV